LKQAWRTEHIVFVEASERSHGTKELCTYAKKNKGPIGR